MLNTENVILLTTTMISKSACPFLFPPPNIFTGETDGVRGVRADDAPRSTSSGGGIEEFVSGTVMEMEMAARVM
jgi:hypothetical protein